MSEIVGYVNKQNLLCKLEKQREVIFNTKAVYNDSKNVRMFDMVADSIYDICINELRGFPITDAVEVVRCGHCEWWKCNPNSEEYGVCKKVSYDDFEVVMHSDDFCSYGERREP